MTFDLPPLAVVTGASSGIGLELARLCAQNGYELVVAADTPLDEVFKLRGPGVSVDGLEIDLATREGVQALYETIAGRQVDVLIANAGHGLGHAFLDQDFEDIKHVIETNVTGTIELIHKIARDMRDRGSGRILITGSIAGFTPGAFQAVYNGTKAFIDSFSWALRNELEGSGITVTCLMPGATETDFFERADLMDTKVGTDKKMDAATVAEIGFQAMMAGEGDVVAGFRNKLEAALANVTPAAVLAERHRKMTEPGSAHR